MANIIRLIPAIAQRMSAFLGSEKFGVLNFFHATNKYIEAADGFKWIRLSFKKDGGEVRLSKLIPHAKLQKLWMDGILSHKEIEINLDEIEEQSEMVYPDMEPFANSIQALQSGGITLALDAKHLAAICEAVVTNNGSEKPVLLLHLAMGCEYIAISHTGKDADLTAILALCRPKGDGGNKESVPDPDPVKPEPVPV